MKDDSSWLATVALFEACSSGAESVEEHFPLLDPVQSSLVPLKISTVDGKCEKLQIGSH